MHSIDNALGKKISEALANNTDSFERRSAVVGIVSLFLKQHYKKPPKYEAAHFIEKHYQCLFPGFYNENSSQELNNLIKLSERDIVYFWGLARISARWLASDNIAPLKLKEWSLSFLRNELKIPQNTDIKYYSHKVYIRHAVDTLVTEGYKISRNDASDHKNTAYDIVSDALYILGANKSYQAVKSICTKV